MIIKVERSGGFAGLSKYSEIDSEDLPASLKETITELIHNNIRHITSKSLPEGTADQYFYKITVDDTANKRVFACDEYNLQDNLKSLIKYIEKHSTKR